MSADFIEMVTDITTRRFSHMVQIFAANRTPCGIFFAPTVPEAARQFIPSFRNSGLNLNCICVLFDEHKKFFQPADGESLVTVEEFPKLAEKPQLIFVTGGFFSLMFMDYFAKFGTRMLNITTANNSENIYNLYMAHLPELYAVHEMLADDESKKVFRASITGKITGLLQDFRFVREPQYFLNGFLPNTGDVAIDGGAYDGATAADFVRNGAQVYAFEMDANNYKKCIPNAEKFGFTLENFGLSDKAEEAFYLPHGTGSYRLAKTSGGGVIAKFINLDTYVEQKNLPRVDYIKLDIEGAELDMLHGAAKTIAHCKPKMAVSAYHKPEDLWTLAPYIKSLRSDYEFKFRHYRIDCTNYIFGDNERAIFRHFGLSYFCPSRFEMVLYCK